MRRYELMLLLRPDLDDEHLQAAVERVTRAIVNAGGSLSKVSPWGKRRLAYEIAHQRDASYFLIHFEIDPAAVRGIERGMLISEEILRHMVTILEDRPTGRTDGDGARAGRPAAAGRVPSSDARSTDDAGEAGSPEASSSFADAEPEPAVSGMTDDEAEAAARGEEDEELSR